MKKHPIVIVFIVIGVIMVLFVGAIVLLTYMFKRETPSLALGDKVGVIEITGVISNSQEIIQELKAFAEDGGIKAIILRVDSPGGGVGASQEIYREVTKAKKVKKVVASLGDVAASGGYYVACGADKIVSNPGTITGSIGVVMQFANLEELMKKIGYKGYVIKSGPLKDIGSPFRDMTEEERILLKEMIDTVHRQFVTAVAEERKLSIEKVEAIADGRIFSGEQALALGLVDNLGNLEDTIELAAKEAGIKGRPHVIYPRRRRPSILDFIMDGIAQRFKQQMQEVQEPHPRLDYIWSQ